MIGALASLAAKALFTPAGLITAGIGATQLPSIQRSIRKGIVDPDRDWETCKSTNH